MNARRIAKRALACLLCMVMMVSCWVFTAPNAVADTPSYRYVNMGSDSTKVYHVEVDIHVLDAGNGYDKAFVGEGLKSNSDTNYKDQGGMVFYYHDNNGTATTENNKIFNFQGTTTKYDNGGSAYMFPHSDLVTSSWGQKNYTEVNKWDDKYYTVYADLSGFPTAYAVYNNNDNASWTGGETTRTEWEINEIRVYAYDSSKNMSSSYYQRFSGETATMEGQANIIFQGGIRTTNWDGDKPSRYKVQQDGTVSLWNPNSFNKYANENGNNWVFFSGNTNGNNAFSDKSSSNSGTYNPQYSKSYQMPAPQLPAYSYTKTYSDSAELATNTANRYWAPDTASLSAAYTVSSIDQYGATLSGSLSTTFIIKQHDISSGDGWTTDQPLNGAFTIADSGTITPVKANALPYHDLTVYPQVTWTPGDGIADKTYDGAETLVGFSFPSYDVSYQYTTNTEPASWTVDNSNASLEYIPAQTATDVESTVNHVLWGDSVTASEPTPDAAHQTYYTVAGHYTNGSYTNPVAAIKANTTVDMAGYDAEVTAHDWSEWASFEGTFNGTFSGVNYHRAVCTEAGSTHYQYQLHQWTQVEGEATDKWINETTGTHAGEHYRLCTECGYKDYDSHDYTSKVTNATCTEEGYITYTCQSAGCGYSYESYPYTESGNTDYQPTGHDISSAYTTDGTYHWRTCNNGCGTLFDDNADEGKSVHSFTNNSVQDETTRITQETCAQTGEYYYTCATCAAVSDTYTYSVGVTAHNWSSQPLAAKMEDARDGQGYLYYQCDGCDQCCPAQYNSSSGTYEAKTSVITSTAEALESASASLDMVPTPFFNDDRSAAMFYQIDYSARPASLRFDLDEDYQGLRFIGSVKIPAGIEFKVNPTADVSAVDNVVLDFGFVWTQTRFICNNYRLLQNELGDPISSTADPSRLVFTGNAANGKPTAASGEEGYQVYQTSVVRNNAASGTMDTTASNWSGVTVNERDATTGSPSYYYSFNLVINTTKTEKADNWAREYSARPYITYKYHGVVYTVYDGGTSAGVGGDKETYSHRSVNSVVNSIMSRDPTYDKTDPCYYWNMYNSGASYAQYLNQINAIFRDKQYVYDKFYSDMTEDEFFEDYCYAKFSDDVIRDWWPSYILEGYVTAQEDYNKEPPKDA